MANQGQNLDAEEVGLTAKKIKIDAFLELILARKISDATTVTAFLLARAKELID